MKVYINARFLTQPTTGVQRFGIEISKHLKCILGDDIEFISPINILNVDLAKELNAKGVGSRYGHLWEQIDLPSYLRKKGNPLLVNLCSSAPISYSNQIVTHHDITYIRHKKSFSWKLRTLYKFLMPRMLGNSIGLITVSEFSKTEISSFYNYPLNKIFVIPNAASDIFTEVKSVNQQEKKYLLAVSSNNYHKNFGPMLQAYSQLGVDMEMIIVGNYNSDSFRNVKMPNEILENRKIVFKGNVKDEELVNLYQNAYAFIFPSLYEGFGIPPLEAQACGCPVLASNSASMPEVLKDSALYFDPYNLEEMKNAIINILENQSLRADLIDKGLKNVRRFSWQCSAMEIVDLIKNSQNIKKY